MFILTHKEFNGYDGGTHATNLFASESRGVLEARKETLLENRAEANALLDEFVGKIDANPDPKRVTNARRTEAEVDKIQKYREELDRLYPFWRLDNGSEGEKFVIQELELI